MLHQAPAKARAMATPVVLIDHLQVFDVLPEDCIAHRVDDHGASLPHLKPGEHAVVDTNQRTLEHGAPVLIQWSCERGIVQTNFRKSFYTKPCWMVDPLNRASSKEDLDIRLAQGGMLYASDGPYSAEGLAEKIVGRVIGVLAPAAVVTLPPPEPPPAAPPRFSPAKFCEDLTAIGGHVSVDASSRDLRVGIYTPCVFDQFDPKRAKAANRTAARLVVKARHPGAKAAIRRYALKIEGEVRSIRPTGSWLVGGVFVIDAAESHARIAGRA